MENDVLHRQHFGALPKRSATDLLACLVHDVEKAKLASQPSRLLSGLLTMDIDGAYNCVLRNRLGRRLLEQGWHPLLVRLIGTFMTDRTARQRNDETPRPLTSGLPQGSPLSPIVFLLYVEPLLKIAGGSNKDYGYVDDVAFLRQGKTLADCRRELQTTLEAVIHWGEENEIRFDLAKSELIYFAPRGDTTCEDLALKIGETVIKPAKSIRWLGMELDSRLSFRPHVDRRAHAALKTATYLRRINGCYRGMSPKATLQAVKAVLKPQAMYAAEAWWPGLERQSHSEPNKIVDTGHKRKVQDLNVALTQGLRAALPVWKTTPTAVLHREGGIPHASVELDLARARFAKRMRYLDDKHPVVDRVRRPRVSGSRYDRRTRLV